MKKKSNHGGKRPNAGRKPSTYKTTTVSCRIRVEWADEMRKFIAEKKRELEEIKL